MGLESGIRIGMLVRTLLSASRQTLVGGAPQSETLPLLLPPSLLPSPQDAHSRKRCLIVATGVEETAASTRTCGGRGREEGRGRRGRKSNKRNR